MKAHRALEGVGWLMPFPGSFILGNDRWAPGTSGRVRKNFIHPGGGGFFFCFVLCTLSVLLFPGFCPLPFTVQHTTQTCMALWGFEPAIPAGERPQAHALDRTSTGIRSPNRSAHSESLYRLSYPGQHLSRFAKKQEYFSISIQSGVMQETACAETCGF